MFTGRLLFECASGGLGFHHFMAKEKHHHADEHNAHTQDFAPINVFDGHAQETIVIDEQARQQLA